MPDKKYPVLLYSFPHLTVISGLELPLVLSLPEVSSACRKGVRRKLSKLVVRDDKNLKVQGLSHEM